MLVTTSFPVGQSSSTPGHRSYSINVTAKANEGLAKVTPRCGEQDRQPGGGGGVGVGWAAGLHYRLDAEVVHGCSEELRSPPELAQTEARHKASEPPPLISHARATEPFRE